MKKPNPVRTWRITLRGPRAKTSVSIFTGTFEEALSEADVLECYESWQVLAITIQAIPE